MLLDRSFCGFGGVIKRRKDRMTNGSATDMVNVVVPSSKCHSMAIWGSTTPGRTFLQYAGQQDKCGRESLVAGTTLVGNL